MPELLVVLPGIHQTLSAEQTLKKRDVPASLVPTPPTVKASCGFSLLVRTQGEGLPSWWDLMDAPAVLYRIVAEQGRRRYEEIHRREGPGLPPAGDHVQKGAC